METNSVEHTYTAKCDRCGRSQTGRSTDAAQAQHQSLVDYGRVQQTMEAGATLATVHDWLLCAECMNIVDSALNGGSET